MKKLLSIFMLIVLLTVTHVGCSTSSDTSEITKTPTASSEVSSAVEYGAKETEELEKLEDGSLVEEIISSAGAKTTVTDSKGKAVPITEKTVPPYSGKAFVVLNNNVPEFKQSDYTTKSYEKYSKLDSLKRCGVCIACIGKDIMPTEPRGEIGMVKPTGWHTVKYDIVDGKYLYNRCHLIGYQLTGENKNESNLITGTRYLNIEGMLPFENAVANYVRYTANHVLYRVTPIFEGNNLLASGVKIEARSIEDNGKGISFNVYCYNAQPGISINYENGDSALSGEEIKTTSQKADTGAGVTSSAVSDTTPAVVTPTVPQTTSSAPVSSEVQSTQPETSQKVTVPTESETVGNLVWVPTKGGKKYHSNPNCSNMVDPIQVSLETAERDGFTPCKRCH